MWCKQTFAIVLNEKVVNDIVCDNYTLANDLARSQYGDKAFAVDSTQYPASIGDYYKNGTFYFKDGTTSIPRQNTAEEDAREANAKAEELSTTLDSVLTEVIPSLTGM